MIRLDEVEALDLSPEELAEVFGALMDEVVRAPAS